jgi:hypothetical protein
MVSLEVLIVLPGCVAIPCVSSVSVRHGSVEVRDVGAARRTINVLLWRSVNEVPAFVALCYCYISWLFVKNNRVMNNILFT